MNKKFISLVLSSAFFGSLACGSDVSLDLTKPKEGETSTGYPISFKYAFKNDGMAGTTSTADVESDKNYFWSKSSGNTLSLVTNSTEVATAIFNAPGNSDNLLLENFNFISVKEDLTTKGQSDTYFAILNGANPYTSFTLNGANIYSGSNLYIGPIHGDTSTSKTGGFANVILKGTIKVNANAVDQADGGSSGKQKAMLSFQSEYNDATYTIDSSAEINLTSTGDKDSTINFYKGTTTTKDGAGSTSSLATGQSVLNKGKITLTNAQANATAGMVGNEHNNINFYIDLHNEGTITLTNATLFLKDGASLGISSGGSVGTINIKANSQASSELKGESEVSNESVIFFNDTSAVAFELASQSINVSGVAPSDASSSTENQELFGSQLTIKADGEDANLLNLVGEKDKLTTITVGASASSGTLNDKHTNLIFDAKGVVLDNYANIIVQSGATLTLKKISQSTRNYETDASNHGKKVAVAQEAIAAKAGANILDFFNQGTITFKGDGVNPNTLDASDETGDKELILTDYATTETTCSFNGEDCSVDSGVTDIPKNATLTTTETESAGTMEFSGGKTIIKASVIYNYGNLKLSDDGVLDLSKLSGSGQIFYNAGVFTSTGGTIDTRQTQETDSSDIDGMNLNKNNSANNTKALTITEAKKQKTKDSSDSGITTSSKTALKEGEVWAANPKNETRAEFVVDTNSTIIRATSLTNNGLTTIQNNGTLSLACVGTDYCYNGRYWTKATTENDKTYVKKPDLSSAKSGDADKFEAKQITWSNGTGGTLNLAGGTISTIDSYRYQDKDQDYKDVTEYIYHSLKVDKGTLQVSGGTSSVIQSGFGGSSNSALELDDVNLAIRGDSRLLIASFKKDSSEKSTQQADVTWKAGSGSNNFTMYLSDDDYTKNTRGFYILGTADSQGNYTGGVIKFTGSDGSSEKLPDFVIDLSQLSGKNTLLLDKQYNFIVAKEIQSGNKDRKITDASKITMKINFGKGANVTDADKPATEEQDYGKYNASLCKIDTKFCLDANSTKQNGSKTNSVSNGSIEIGGSNDREEGVVVVDGDSKLDDSITGWPNVSKDTETKKNNAYSDFVTFNKIYKEGTGTCNFNTLEGCAIIGFSAVKSKTLEDDGVAAVFQNIKDRANQLPETKNDVIKNTLSGIDLIERANKNAVEILQQIVDTDGVASSNLLLNLQKFQYTGDLSLAQYVAQELNHIDNALDMVANASSDSLEQVNRLNFTSTLSTNMRLAYHSNPYMSNSFAQMIKTISKEKLAANGNDFYSYTDRFDYDHNVWGQIIGGFGGKYSGGYTAIGGFSAGYDKMLGRILLGGYATYAYSYSGINAYQGDAGVNSSKNSNNLELGGYLRAYIDVHEIDVVLSETFGFDNLAIKGDNLINQNLNFSNFTTNFTARYGYVFAINPESGFYVKPLVGINYIYQYNTTANGSGEAKIIREGQHANLMTLSAFAELRKYTDEKRYFYFMPGIEQDVFVYNSNGEIYFASSANNTIRYSVDNQYRTYLTLMGGGEIGIRDNMSVTFGVGARISWDRYFLNANVGFKYKFNTQ